MFARGNNVSQSDLRLLRQLMSGRNICIAKRTMAASWGKTSSEISILTISGMINIFGESKRANKQTQSSRMNIFASVLTAGIFVTRPRVPVARSSSRWSARKMAKGKARGRRICLVLANL